MQFKIVSAFLIFIGSYLPLALILAIQDIPIAWWEKPFCDFSDFSTCVYIPFDNPSMSITFIAITVFSVFLGIFTLKNISYSFDIEVESSKSIPNDIINYVFPYVVSFMGISYDTPEKLLGFSIFLLWMFAITYKSGQIIMNPLLLMFGWKLFEARIINSKQSRDVRVLMQGDLTPGVYKAQTIQDFYVARSI